MNPPDDCREIDGFLVGRFADGSIYCDGMGWKGREAIRRAEADPQTDWGAFWDRHCPRYEAAAKRAIGRWWLEYS